MLQSRSRIKYFKHLCLLHYAKIWFNWCSDVLYYMHCTPNFEVNRARSGTTSSSRSSYKPTNALVMSAVSPHSTKVLTMFEFTEDWNLLYVHDSVYTQIGEIWPHWKAYRRNLSVLLQKTKLLQEKTVLVTRMHCTSIRRRMTVL